MNIFTMILYSCGPSFLLRFKIRKYDFTIHHKLWLSVSMKLILIRLFHCFFIRFKIQYIVSRDYIMYVNWRLVRVVTSKIQLSSRGKGLKRYSPWLSGLRFLIGTSPPSCWFTSRFNWQFCDNSWVFSCSSWYIYSAVCWSIAAWNKNNSFFFFTVLVAILFYYVKILSLKSLVQLFC